MSQFPIYAELGAGIFQMELSWADVATRRPTDARDPNDPAYAWPVAVDRAIAEASRYGIQVSLLVYKTPSWANGGRDKSWAPTRPREYAQFVAAAARRYSRVRLWMIWGEPTKSDNFQPLSPDGGRPLRGAQLRGPRRYAQMLDGSYRELKRISRRNLVIGGNSFTVGTVRPRNWIRALRLPGGRPPRMDLYGHNPFSVRSPRLSNAPLGRGYADFSDLDELARWVDRNLKRGRSRPRLFLSEFSLPTDHANDRFNFYVSRETQARWLSRALQITRKWKRIYSFGYLGLYDPPLAVDGLQVDAGLVDRHGTRKPAFEAFKRG